MEILIPNAAIRNLIREDKIHQIYSVMQTGQEKLGMQTFNQSLLWLWQKQLISRDVAMNAASNRDELEDMMRRAASGDMGQRPRSGPSGQKVLTSAVVPPRMSSRPS